MYHVCFSMGSIYVIMCVFRYVYIQQQQQLSHLSQVFRVGYMKQKRIMSDREHGSAFSTHSYRAIYIASISCRMTSIHIFFGLPCALLICPNLIRATRRIDASVGLRRTWPNYRRRFSLNFSSIGVTPILVRISSFLTLSYHASNEACASPLHLSSGYDIFLWPNIFLCHITKLA